MVREITLDDVEDAYGLVIYDVELMPPVIHQLWVPPAGRRAGAGTRLLHAAMDFASRHGDEVLLAPVPDRTSRGPSVDELVAWYERHGFAWQPNHNMMVHRFDPAPFPGN